MSPHLASNSGKTPIFLLKTRSSPHDGYEEYFSAERGYLPLFIPVLEHKFRADSLQIVRDLFLSGRLADEYGGLIFTSQRAVEGFSTMLHNEVGKQISAPLSLSLCIYTVGPATYRSLDILRSSHLPHAQIVGEHAGTGEQLANLIIPHYNEHHKMTTSTTAPQRKKPLLFLVGEQHRDVIPNALSSDALPSDERIEVKELIVYETGVMHSFADDFEKALNHEEQEFLRSRQNNADVGEGKRIVWVVVFSPTGCDVMLRYLGLLQGEYKDHEDNRQTSSGTGDDINRLNRWARLDCRIATIGPTTRNHLLSNFAVEADVCAEVPSPQGVGKGIETFMAGRGQI
ncbi:hypothetical protein FQN57_001462 [Myotisia sp. PD_48]|nr:hypothetical protein FQN57_001462 [Myotisia sp. PD_48]